MPLGPEATMAGVEFALYVHVDVHGRPVERATGIHAMVHGGMGFT